MTCQGRKNGTAFQSPSNSEGVMWVPGCSSGKGVGIRILLLLR